MSGRVELPGKRLPLNPKGPRGIRLCGKGESVHPVFAIGHHDGKKRGSQRPVWRCFTPKANSRETNLGLQATGEGENLWDDDRMAFKTQLHCLGQGMICSLAQDLIILLLLFATTGGAQLDGNRKREGKMLFGSEVLGSWRPAFIG